MQRSVAYKSVEENSVAKRSVTTVDAVSVSSVLKNAIDLHDGEPELFAWNLTRSGLGAEFLEWFVSRVKTTHRERGIRNAKGFIAAFLKDPAKHSSWIAEFHQETQVKPKRPDPPGSCPHCGSSEFKNGLNGAMVTSRMCMDCGTWLELDLEQNEWGVAPETVPSKVAK